MRGTVIAITETDKIMASGYRFSLPDLIVSFVLTTEMISHLIDGIYF